MKPIKFPGANVVFGAGQKEYIPLPAYREPGATGQVTTCWQLTWRERWKILFTGRVWYSVLTFGDALQPQRPSVDCPLAPKDKKS